MEDLYGTDAYNAAFGLTPLKYAKGNANGQVAKANTIGNVAGRTGILPTLTAFNAGINPNEVYAKAGLQTAQGSYTGINDSWEPSTGASDSYAARNARIAALMAAGMSDSDARIEADNGFHIAESDADRESRMAGEFFRATGYAPELKNQQVQVQHPAYAPLVRNPPTATVANLYKAPQAGGPNWRAGATQPATVGAEETPTAIPAAATMAAQSPQTGTGFKLPTNQFKPYGSGFARSSKAPANFAYRRSLQYDR